MSNRRFPGTGSVTILLMLSLSIFSVGVHADALGGQLELMPAVRCDPTTATGVIGVSDVVVDMYVEDVVGLNAVDLRISFFDTTIAQVVDQLPAMGVQIQPLNTFLQPDFTVRNSADNMAGTIRYATTQSFPSLPVDGSGPVARITLQGVQPGVFTMTWGTVELADVNGALIPAIAEPCVITFESATAVTLANFEALPQFDHILVAWETASEIDNLGFNLYRATAPGGPLLRLNDVLIPSQAPGSSQGYSYNWQDYAVAGATTYDYWLESVSTLGTTEQFGPVSATSTAHIRLPVIVISSG